MAQDLSSPEQVVAADAAVEVSNAATVSATSASAMDFGIKPSVGIDNKINSVRVVPANGSGYCRPDDRLRRDPYAVSSMIWMASVALLNRLAAS